MIEDDSSIRHNSGFCLDIIFLNNTENLVMAECDKNKESQKWMWQKNKNKKHILFNK
jgi:hypothetical protein